MVLIETIYGLDEAEGHVTTSSVEVPTAIIGLQFLCLVFAFSLGFYMLWFYSFSFF